RSPGDARPAPRRTDQGGATRAAAATRPVRGIGGDGISNFFLWPTMIQLLPLAHHDPTSSSGPPWSVNKPRLRKSTLLIAATLGFGVLYLAGAIALGTTPEPG